MRYTEKNEMLERNVSKMAKVAILVPYLDMCEMARSLVSAYRHIDPICVEYTQTDHVADRARALVQGGCDLIVSRGTQASLIKQSVEIPVVELKVTAQELGRLFLNLKQELRAERPRIALIGFANMFGDMSQFNDLFQIDLQCYMVAEDSQLSAMVEQALSEECQAVVGGDIVCQKARDLGLPCCFIPSGTESMRNALQIASSLCYAIDLEKKNSAEMDTMLNYTFNGIMQVDPDGVIRRINRTGYNILGRLPADIIGQPVVRVVPQITLHLLDSVLTRGEETYALVMDVPQKAIIVNMAPILVDGRIDGAILTFQEGQRISEMDSEMRRELYQRGFIAKYSFEKLALTGSRENEQIKLARRIAKYSDPVLITGPAGIGKDMMAQCLHNESLCKANAFVPVDCSAWQPDNLDTLLFGNFTTRKDSEACMAELAKDGTLYLDNVEKLPFETQYKLKCLIDHRFFHNGVKQAVSTFVRVIASTTANLAALVEKGAFRRDLYYALSVLNLEMAPLRGNRPMIAFWLDRYLQEWQEHYKRYVHLTNGARAFLETYDWPGNVKQINHTCQRIVLLTEKRSIDEVFIRHQLEQVTPRLLPGTDKVVLYKDPKAVEIAELLRAHGGNREEVAAALGVSKTTLWRYIKKYGIEQDYTY